MSYRGSLRNGREKGSRAACRVKRMIPLEPSLGPRVPGGPRICGGAGSPAQSSCYPASGPWRCRLGEDDAGGRTAPEGARHEHDPRRYRQSACGALDRDPYCWRAGSDPAHRRGWPAELRHRAGQRGPGPRRRVRPADWRDDESIRGLPTVGVLRGERPTAVVAVHAKTHDATVEWHVSNRPEERDGQAPGDAVL